jgi:hypothetical protein
MSDTITIDMLRKEPKIARTWISGRHKQYEGKSILMAIPAVFTKDYSLEKPTNVLVTPTENGLLIKKLELKE